MNLKSKITKSERIIKKASRRYSQNKIAITYKGGKDSTVLISIVRRLYGEVPFPLFFNDSTLEFDEVYEFIDKIEKKWELKLMRMYHSKVGLKEYHKATSKSEKSSILNNLKIEAIKKALEKYDLQGFMVGIRRDENKARSREKYFSERNDHIRIHPILDFTEKDIWEYIKKFNVPYCKLYDKGYRSLGEAPFTKPVKDHGDERSGRERDKEEIMKRLRALGYW